MTAPPETYYEMLPERLPNHGEPTEELKNAAFYWMVILKMAKNAFYFRSFLRI